jgi:hypothetical protein
MVSDTTMTVVAGLSRHDLPCAVWNSGPTRRPPASPSKRWPRRMRLVRDSVRRRHCAARRSGYAAQTKVRA